MLASPRECSESLAVERLRQGVEMSIARCELELPLLPQVAGEVLFLAIGEEADAASVAELLHRDQTLAGHVLRCVNSAAFGGVTPILSLRQAVARLGLDRLTEVVMSLCVGTQILNVNGYESYLNRLWRHSVGSALLAKQIARLRRTDGDATFLCGLLQNVGYPVALKALTRLQKRLRLSLGPPEILPLADEHASRAGALLAVKWGLPRPVLESIIYCNAGGAGNPSARSEVLSAYLGDRLARHLLEPESLPAEDLDRLPQLAELGLGPRHVALLLADGPEVVERIKVLVP